MSRRNLALTVAALAALVVGICVALLLASGSSKRRRAPKTAIVTSTITGIVTSTATGRSTATADPPARPPPAGETFGVNINLLFSSGTYSNAQIDTQLREVQATGATVARSDAFWEATEPTAPVNGVHDYNWAFDDGVALALAQHGLQWLPILDYTAPWAESVPGQDHSPPRSAADYAAYAGAFAARYGPGGTFWHAHPRLTAPPVQTYEIWNEPDNGEFWAPTPDARRYGVLYQQAREAITSADPRARVIVGGLMNPTHFLVELLSADPALRGHIDGVAIHPYGTPLVVLARVRSARATLGTLGLGAVPLYVTEFGWTTRPAGAVNYAPASARPRYLVDTLGALGHVNCGVAAALLYTWVTPERNTLNAQDWYGISNPHGGGGADVAAFEAGLRAARAARPVIPLCRG